LIKYEATQTLGLWNSSFYLGNFAGPTISGFVVDAIGFRNTALTFVPVFAMMLLANFAEFLHNVKRHKKMTQYEEIK
jgi:predicted MFS family arabinose efflux permease